jgi:hypothetical protein
MSQNAGSLSIPAAKYCSECAFTALLSIRDRAKVMERLPIRTLASVAIQDQRGAISFQYFEKQLGQLSTPAGSGLYHRLSG